MEKSKKKNVKELLSWETWREEEGDDGNEGKIIRTAFWFGRRDYERKGNSNFFFPSTFFDARRRLLWEISKTSGEKWKIYDGKRKYKRSTMSRVKRKGWKNKFTIFCVFTMNENDEESVIIDLVWKFSIMKETRELSNLNLKSKLIEKTN